MNPGSPYRPGREIARGGMGAVLDARDQKLGRSVAMKVMLRRNASEEEQQRFLQEARVLGQLAHPNIVPVHDVGTDEQGRLFYTMKLVVGVTLHDVLGKLKAGDKDTLTKYPLNALLTIFQKVCDAVAFAQSRGIIHRDLKPQNIMVGEFGEVLVMDWGLAKILPGSPAAEEAAKAPTLRGQLGQTGPTGTLPLNSPAAEDQATLVAGQSAEADATLVAGSSAADDATIAVGTGNASARKLTFGSQAPEPARPSGAFATLEGAVMGTPHFMSPEQAEGKIAELDGRSDIFSLGGILYALLTLRPPVEGDSLEEILSKVRSGTIAPPTAFNAPSSTTQGQDTATGAVTEPRKIYPLPHCPDGKVPTALSAVTMKALTRDKTRRYQTVAEFTQDITAYQGGFATSAENADLLTLALLFFRRNKVLASAVALVLLVILIALPLVIASERKAKANAEAAAANAMAARAEAERATKAEKSAKSAEALAVEKGEAARQSLAKAALNLAEAAQREGNGPEMQAALAQVPEDLRDSTHGYLLDQSDTSIARIRSEGDAIDSVAAHPRRPGVFAIADNGKVILMEVRTGARLLEFDPGLRLPPTAKTRFPIKLAFSPDGERIAVGRAGVLRIVVHSARDGKKLLEWEAPSTLQLEFSPDGRLLLQKEHGGKLFTIWDAATGQPRWKNEDGYSFRGSFTPDSQHLITRGDGRPVRLVRAQDGTLVRELSKLSVSAFAVRPDGKMVVIGGRFGDKGKIQGVFLQDAKVAFEFRAHDRDMQHIAFTPDGARFVSVAVLADGRQAIQVWDANTGAPLQTLLGGSGSVSDASVHPLSGELVVVGQNTRAWNLTGTPEKWTLRGGGNSSIAFWGSDDWVFAANESHNAALQKLQPGSPDLLWKPLHGRYRRPSVSSDGRFAAIGHIAHNIFEIKAEDVFLLRNPGTQTEQAAVFKAPYALTLLRLNPVGDRLATLELKRERADVVDPSTGKPLSRLEGKEVKKFWDLGWLSGGQQLVGLVTAKADRGNPGSEEWIVLWNAATGKMVQTTTNRTAMDVLAVAPDGRRFAEAGADKKVRIRDAATLAVQQEFRAHDGPITALAWHPTKPIMATASADLSVKLWNLETGRRLEELRAVLTVPTELAFSPSGRRLGCAGDGDPTRIWDAAIAQRPAPRRQTRR